MDEEVEKRIKALENKIVILEKVIEANKGVFDIFESYVLKFQAGVLKYQTETKDTLAILLQETRATNEYVKAAHEKIESTNKIFKGYSLIHGCSVKEFY